MKGPRWLAADTVVRRTALILTGAIGFSLLLVYLLFQSQRFFSFHTQQTILLAEMLSATVSVVDAASPSARGDLLGRLSLSRMHFEIGGAPVVDEAERGGEDGGLSAKLLSALPGRDVRVVTKAFAPSDRPDPDNRLRPGEALIRSAEFNRQDLAELRSVSWFSVRLTDGAWLNGFILLRRPGDFFQHPRMFDQILLSMILVAAIALWAVSRLSQPVRQFSEAAERLGRDIAAPGLSETGPLEFRQAARAFNVMRDRVRRLVEDRTHMLAAISHDLRTPITRLRLRLEFVEDSPERNRMLDDLDEMERLIAATMIFAGETVPTEERRTIDIASLALGAVADFSEMGTEINYDGPDSLLFNAHPLAIKRAVVNVIDNARKYGGGVSVSLSRVGGDIVMIVDDAGPGIPPELREKVFSPFVRLEKSRSRDTGGNGLGLSIARAAVRAHGGDVLLSDSPAKGLRVTITLPI